MVDPVPQYTMLAHRESNTGSVAVIDDRCAHLLHTCCGYVGNWQIFSCY
jgi:hypothetical protein